MQRASEFSGEQNLNGIQPERPSSSQCTPPLSQPHSVVSEARFSHGRSDGLAFLGGLAWLASVKQPSPILRETEAELVLFLYLEASKPRPLNMLETVPTTRRLLRMLIKGACVDGLRSRARGGLRESLLVAAHALAWPPGPGRWC